jgi:hypothetical protein
LNKLSKAIYSYNIAIEIENEDVEIYFDLSRVHINKKEYEYALNKLFLLIDKKKDSAPAYALVGTMYIETNRMLQSQLNISESKQQRLLNKD